MKLYEQLKDIEFKYNLYDYTKEEAVNLAKPIIEEINTISRKLAAKYNQRPRLVNLKQFAFGN